MGVEVLVYVYLAVCLAMITFNVGTVIRAKHRNKINENLEREYGEVLEAEAKRIRRGLPVGDGHISYMKHRLRRSEHLLVFVSALHSQNEVSPDEMKVYVTEIAGAISSLAAHYERQHDTILYAFFLYTLRVFNGISGVLEPHMADILIRALRINNTYCRENALQAIYSSGQTELVIRALQLLDSEGIAHNKKLLCDGLLTFKGNKEELMGRLWDVFETFGTDMQTVILDFIRFCSPAYRERMLDILKDEKRSPELRFSSIRYFAKYPDEEAYPILLGMANDFENSRWEFPAIACTALASYPGERTVETLKRALHVASWYVRYNAAESLARLGVSYLDLIEVIDGNDRFAREMLQFQLDMQYNRRKEVAAH